MRNSDMYKVFFHVCGFGFFVWTADFGLWTADFVFGIPNSVPPAGSCLLACLRYFTLVFMFFFRDFIDI
jgi:hypothetical protein